MMSLHHARGLGLGLGQGLATVTGPVVCAKKALTVMPLPSQQQQQQQGVDRPPSSSMLMGDRVVALCQGAAGEGPATCFNEGKQLRVTLITATNDQRSKGKGGGAGAGAGGSSGCTTGGGTISWQWQWLVELCAGAPSVGPALCFRRSSSITHT